MMHRIFIFDQGDVEWQSSVTTHAAQEAAEALRPQYCRAPQAGIYSAAEPTPPNLKL